MKIGIFGGTFNPIHIGHLRPIEEVREFFKLNKVLFVLAKIPPHKLTEKILDAKIRFEILKIALQDNDFFIPSDIELKREGKSYTYYTIKKISDEHKKDEIFLIIGKDSFYELRTWFNWDKILIMTNLIVLNRKISEKIYDNDSYLKELNYRKINNSEYINNFNKKIFLFDNSIIEVSSSKIRENFKKGFSNRYLLPENVLKFITDKKLYF